MDRKAARKEINARWKELYPATENGQGIICPLCGYGNRQNEEGITEASGTKHYLLSCRNPNCRFRDNVIYLFMKEQGIKSFRNAVTMLAERLDIQMDAEWERSTKYYNDFSCVLIKQEYYNFDSPADYLKLSDSLAEKLAEIGKTKPFVECPPLSSFRLEIDGGFHSDTQIGSIINNMKCFRGEVVPYGLYARFLTLSIHSFYVAITFCLVDKDRTSKIPVAVLKIGQQFCRPICVNERAVELDKGVYSFKDIKNLAKWLRCFWCGVQFEIINRPENIIIANRFEHITGNSTTNSEKDHVVVVKHDIRVDEYGNRIDYEYSESRREYHTRVWGVRGHPRTLPDGRVTMVRPYLKGKDRNNPNLMNEKEYRFGEGKIDDDLKH